MKRRSITTKIIVLVSLAFALTFVSVIFVANKQITQIIDKTQNNFFNEKLDLIWEHLDRSHSKLKQTGQERAYENDFKKAAKITLENTYYKEKNPRVYPYIVDSLYNIIIHPEMKTGDKELLKPTLESYLKQSPQGHFNEKIFGEDKWFTYKHFQPWKWTIIYSVPLKIKYQEAHALTQIIGIIMLFIMIFVLFILSTLIRRHTSPIQKLTETASQIAGGDFSQPFAIQAKDEIGSLAQSFESMRKAINTQINELNNEIQARKKSEIEIRHLRNYLSNIVNSMPSMLIGIREDGVVYNWNMEAEKVSGISQEEAINKQLQHLIPRLKSDLHLVKKAIKTKTKQSVLRRKIEQNERFEDITIYPLVENGIEGAVIRIDDVTDQVQLELQLRQSQKMDAIGQLAGGIAHDFNNMLTGILGAAELLKSPDNHLNSECNEYVDMIQNAGEMAADLTNKLLLFSRKTKDVSSPINIHQIIEDSVAILKRSINKSITLTCNLNAENNKIIGDDTQIQNSIINMCINSSHAMPDGGIISISTTNIYLNKNYCKQSQFNLESGSYIKIEISDTGEGIAEENLNKIFDPFFTTKAQGKGTGLGLAAVFGIIKNHNGAIEVHSEVNKGSTFKILLPSTQNNKLIITPKEEFIMGSGKILVVDDEEMIRKITQHMLESLGYDVETDSNGMDAIKRVEANPQKYDLIILDMIMPQISGRETFAQLKNINPELKVLLSSGFSKPEDVSQLQENGLRGFIHKPFRKVDISKEVARIINES